MVSALHLELTKVCGRYGTVLAALHQELLRAIYPDYKPGDCPARQNLTYEITIHRDLSSLEVLIEVFQSSTTVESVRVCMCACRPCFLRTQQLAAENLRLRFELGAYEDQAGFLEEEQRRRTVAVNLTAKMCATETA